MKNKVFTCENLSISFGGLKAIDSLSFEIYENEILGLIGPNGAGKTTIFNCMTQFYKPDSGKLQFHQKNGETIELTEKKVHQIIGLGLTRTFQNIELVEEMSLLDNVLVGAHNFYTGGALAQAFQLPKAKKEEQTFIQEAERILDVLEIKELRYQLAMSQPYGVRKKVELARALMSKPRLLILDEPAAGLNDHESEQMLEMIRRIKEKYDCSILLVEHDMSLVMNLCDRICAIDFGKLLAIGTPEEIKNNRQVQEAYLGV